MSHKDILITGKNGISLERQWEGEIIEKQKRKRGRTEKTRTHKDEIHTLKYKQGARETVEFVRHFPIFILSLAPTRAHQAPLGIICEYRTRSKPGAQFGLN